MKAGRLAQLDVEHAAGFNGNEPFGIMLVAAVFVRHDRYGRCRRYAWQVHEAGAVNGLFAMLDIKIAQRLQYGDRLAGRSPALVGIDAQRMLVADTLSDGADPFHISILVF